MRRFAAGLVLLTSTACVTRPSPHPPFDEVVNARIASGTVSLPECGLPFATWHTQVNGSPSGVSSADGRFRLSVVGHMASATLDGLPMVNGRHVVTLQTVEGIFNDRTGYAEFYRLVSAEVVDRSTGQATACRSGQFQLEVQLSLF